jgi:inhibitor of cysteine peptidase
MIADSYYSSMMRGLVPLVIVGVLIVVLVTVVPPPNKSITPESYELKRFTSYEELKLFLSKAQESIMGSRQYMVDDRIGIPPINVQRTFTFTESLNFKPPRFSETNIQEAGVDEEDIVKTDGEYIYLARDNLIFIIKAYPAEDASLLATVNATGPVSGLYVSGDRLAALTGNGPIYAIPEVCINCRIIGKPIIAANATIQVFDITDRRNPIEVRRASVSGYAIASRMIGDYVYLITTEPVILPLDGDDVVLPSYSYDQHIHNVRPVEIYYTDIPDYGYTYTNVMALNIRDEDEAPTITAIMAPSSGIVYVSRENIYIVSPHWGYAEETIIHRLAVEGPRITPAAVGTVPGHPLNQFSLDEYEGHLRIATTLSRSTGGSVNNIYVLDLGLELVGKVEGLAPGETIYSARFMGDKAYLVTFRKVDPLFVVDLRELRVLGKLKIPGYSSYLHPYGDHYLIGIGKDAKPSETGDFAWFQGLKISLFDVSDYSNPREIDSLILGDRGTESEVLYNHRAFLFDDERNILVIPVLLAVIDPADFGGTPPPDAYGEFVFQGVYVFRVTPSDGIEIVGRITHLPDDTDQLRSGEFFESRYITKRALFIGDILYTISDGKVLLNDIQTLRELAGITLPHQAG